MHMSNEEIMNERVKALAMIFNSAARVDRLRKDFKSPLDYVVRNIGLCKETIQIARSNFDLANEILKRRAEREAMRR